MRLPNPPAGIVSWLGNSRSYDSNPISGRLSIVTVMSQAASFRASRAGTASEKKIHACAPLPDCDRSSATCTEKTVPPVAAQEWLAQLPVRAIALEFDRFRVWCRSLRSSVRRIASVAEDGERDAPEWNRADGLRAGSPELVTATQK